jgi:hypothetical protein
MILPTNWYLLGSLTSNSIPRIGPQEHQKQVDNPNHGRRRSIALPNIHVVMAIAYPALNPNRASIPKSRPGSRKLRDEPE